MKLNTFLKQFDKITDENERVEFLKKHLKRTYIPFIERNNAARRTVEATHVINDKYEQNTQLLEMFKALDFIELFTDIEFNRIEDGQPVSADVYDELMSRGVIERFESILTFDQREVWDGTYYNTLDDLKQNMISTYTLINHSLNRISDIVNEIDSQISNFQNNELINDVKTVSQDIN